MALAHPSTADALLPNPQRTLVSSFRKCLWSAWPGPATVEPQLLGASPHRGEAA